MLLEPTEPVTPENISAPATSKKLLGHAVVATSLDTARSAVMETPIWMWAGRPPEKLLKANLDEVRENFLDTDSSQKKRAVKSIFKAEDMPKWLVDGLGGDAITPEERFDRISAVDEQGNNIVSDETLTNFLEWHAYRTEQKQIAFEKEVVAPLRQKYVERFQAAIDAGWLPADTLDESRMKRIMETPVYFDDDFGLDRLFGGFFGHAAAYANSETDKPEIVLRYGTDKNSLKKIDSTFTHEMTHIITGATPHRDRPTGWEEAKATPTYGLSRILDKDTHIGSNLNEATTQHFTQALLTGDIDSLHILGKGSIYMANRYFMKRLCTAGKIKISPRLFVRAMFDGESYKKSSGHEGPSDTPAVRELRSAIEQAFPNGDAIKTLTETEQEYPITGGSLTLTGIRKVVKRLKRAA